MAIIEKYERFINYMYPIMQNCSRKHGVARDKFLSAMFDQIELFNLAGKSTQISRLYSADSNLASLRFWLRFLSNSNHKPLIMTSHQHKTALNMLAEVGKMLGAWIRTAKSGG